MSLEQAILEHTSALRELASAIRESTAGVQVPVDVVMRTTVVEDRSGAVDPVLTKALEIQKKGAERAAAAKQAQEKDAAENKTRTEAEKHEEAGATDDELETAVQEVEQKALDYKTDVRPVLLQVAKKEQAKLVELLAKYGAKTGDKLAAEHYSAIVADANAFLAG